MPRTDASARPLPLMEAGTATRVDVAALVERVGFGSWLTEHWHAPNRQGFTRCPNGRAHAHGHDSEPYTNCHVYPDHLYCFACGARYDLVDLAIWLGHARDFPSAVSYLEALGGHRPARSLCA